MTIRKMNRAQYVLDFGKEIIVIFTHGGDGRPFTKTAQVRMCGNSVSPPPATALLRANYVREQPQQLRRAS